MIGRRRFSLTVAVCLLSGTPHHAGAADPVVPTETAFLSALDRARSLLAGGNATAGQKALDEALVVHAQQDYVRAKRGELEELVRRLAFCCECPPPDPATLVKGVLKKWVSKTGDIELHEFASKPTDFTPPKEGDSLIFPARFTGPYTLTVKGGRYPMTAAETPRVQVGFEDDPKTKRNQLWAIIPGIPPYNEGNMQHWLPSKIVYKDGPDEKIISDKETSLAKPGAPWKLDVQVMRSKVIASINGKVFATSAKSENIFGIAVFDVHLWTEIVIDGRIEPSWIQSKVDAIVETKHAAFEKTFDPKTHLPPWVYEKGASVEAPAESGAPTELADVPIAVRVEVLRIYSLLVAEDQQGALDAIAAARGQGLPEVFASLLEARAHMGLDQPTQALEDVERALVASPNFVGALAAKAEILESLGRDDESLTVWQAAAARPGAPTDVFVTACRSLLFAGQLDAARKISEDAARLGHHAKELDLIGRVLVQASSGPAWPKTFEYRSANYQVSSDMDVETCHQAAQVLEDALLVYRGQVHALKSERKQLYRVFLFSGVAGFGRYLTDITALSRRKPENVAGIYSGLVKQLLIWNLPSRDEMYETVRHEGFHQYLDRLLPNPPVWFNEGMATYYEGMKGVGGQMKPGEPRRESLDLLKDKPLIPFAKFLQITPAAFYAGGRHSYAQAWLLVHIMRHGVGKYRDLYKALMSKLETSSGSDAVREVFDEKTMSTIDAELEAYRQTLTK